VYVRNFAANLVKILQMHFSCLTKRTLGALSSRSALSVLVGALFKKLSLFLNTVVFIPKWLPCQTKPNIWQMMFHFSLGLNQTVFKSKQNKPDPVGSQVLEFVS
jgi:hypothetical protein